jgi:hypothetical protein
MGLLDSLANTSFKTTDDGITLFYPYGIWGKGYVVPTIEKRQEIVVKLKRFIAITFAVIIPVGSIVFAITKTFSPSGWITGLIFLLSFAVLSFIDQFARKQIVKDLMPVDDKLTLSETLKHSAKSQSIVLLLTLLVT